ncbi:unnamed protein product [Polarella glacialis]|uniref:Protein-serine/threonine kinase n=1 Tax=Polarella glacialis TaxID=89957 RepID=A0A813LGZ2_POLGL|nr:unnamed protein product [Polarella glacialis]CAE8728089.1 unnamed protein product [Polarella glacialis]
MAAPTSASSVSRGLNLASLRRVRRLWNEDVQRITVSELWSQNGELQESPEQRQLRLARQTHQQLKLRIAHRLKDFLFLPYKTMSNPSVRLLYEKYVAAYSMHEDFGEISSTSTASAYWQGLAHTFEDHQNVTLLLGLARRRLIRLDPTLAPTLDAFFSRFFVSRIGTHLLGACFLQQAALPGARKPGGVAMGVLQPTCPATFLQDLAESINSASGGPRVPVEILGATDASILYIPGHLRVILREILQNSMLASATLAEAHGKSEPIAVRVQINQGQFGVFVTVSDKAGGIVNSERLWSWGQDPALLQDLEPEAGAPGGAQKLSSEDSEGEEEELLASRTSGVRMPLGFGLPVARLTARYFGGDVRLQTLLGYGTNVYAHIPQLQGNIGSDDSSASIIRP